MGKKIEPKPSQVKEEQKPKQKSPVESDDEDYDSDISLRSDDEIIPCDGQKKIDPELAKKYAALFARMGPRPCVFEIPMTLAEDEIDGSGSM